MRAAKNFSYGDGEKTKVFRTGEEVPKKIADELDDELILEKVAKSNPSSLTRDQLLVLAGIENEDEEPIGPGEEISEEQFREGLKSLKSKADLADWAKEFFDLELDPKSPREDMEEAIVEHQFNKNATSIKMGEEN